MNLLEIFYIIFKNRWLIIRNVFFFTVVSLIISLAMTKIYRSTASVLPVNTEGGGITSFLGGFTLNVFERNIVIPEAYRIILNSNNLKDSLIKKFNLYEVYDEKYREFVYKKLDQNILVEIDKELGFGYSPVVGISISVMDESPQRSSDMANYCIEYLKLKLDELNSHYVEKKYNFIEGRYVESGKNLEIAELNLRGFQEKYGIIELTEQFKLIFQNLAYFEAEKEKLEIELAMIDSSIGPNSPIYQKYQINIDVLNKKIDELVSGTKNDDSKIGIFYPRKILPEIAIEYYQLYREVQVQIKLHEMITVQYEQTKLQVEKKLPSLLILDYAKVPTYKYKPKRIFIVLSGFLFSAIISLFYVFFIEFYRDERNLNSRRYELVRAIKDMFLSDIRKIFRK